MSLTGLPTDEYLFSKVFENLFLAESLKAKYVLGLEQTRESNRPDRYWTDSVVAIGINIERSRALREASAYSSTYQTLLFAIEHHGHTRVSEMLIKAKTYVLSSSL